jgi:preprotein translocase subunit YajC
MANFLLWFQLAMLAIKLFQALQDEKKSAEEKQKAVVTAIDKADSVLPKAGIKTSLTLISPDDMQTFVGAFGWLSKAIKENK